MQKCSTTLKWFLNTQKKSILCNFIMKRHPETQSCRVNAHRLPREWTPWTAGVGAPLSVTYTPLLILSPGCHVPISAILVTAWHSCAHRSCKGEVKIRKISPRHKFLLELGGNSHPQSWPSHITSPHEKAQEPAEETTLHLLPQSPAEAALSIPCSSPSRGHTCLCRWMANHIMSQNTACVFVPLGWDFSWINSSVVQTTLVQTQGRG